VSVEVLGSRNLEGQTPVLTRQADGLWVLSLGPDTLARAKSRNELLNWALYGQGAKGVQTMPSADWDFRKDDT
jgi:hypothetical protein